MTDAELIQSLIDAASELQHRDEENLDALRRRAGMIIRKVFGDASGYLQDLNDINLFPTSALILPTDTPQHIQQEHDIRTRQSNERIWHAGKAQMLNLFNTMLEDSQMGLAKNVEAMAALTEIKVNLDSYAQKCVKKSLWLYFSALVMMWFGLGVLICKLGWDTMEPWTYFLGGGVTLSSYAYFIVTQRELSPKTIYNQLVRLKEKKVYQTFGLDLEQYERLIS